MFVKKISKQKSNFKKRVKQVIIFTIKGMEVEKRKKKLKG